MKLKNLAAALWLGTAALLASAPAYAQSAALVSGTPVTNNCSSWAGGNGIKNSGVKCELGQISTTDAVNGGSVMLAPNNFLFPNSPTLLNNTPGKPLILQRGVATTGQDAGDFECYRAANYSGTSGQPHGFVNPCIFSYTIASAGTGAGTPSGGAYEWSLLSRLDNYSNIADGTENVAAYLQGRKYGTAPTWGAVIEAIDFAANPTAGLVADEHDISVSGADNNNARVGFDLWARNIDALWSLGSPVTSQVAYGLRLNTDAYTTIKTGLKYNGHYINGINMAGATFDSAGLVLGDSHAICFDDTCLRKKFFSAGVTYQSVPTLGNVFSWSDAGQFTATTLNSGGGNVLFGGATSSYPMLKRSGASVEIRKADDSSRTDIAAQNYITPSGGQLCLNDITCTSYVKETSGSLTLGAASGTINTASNISAAKIILPVSGKVCLDSTTCSAYLNETGGIASLVASGGLLIPGTISSGNVQATSFSSAGNASIANVILPTNGKVCLDSVACTVYMLYNSSNGYIQFYNGGTQIANISSSGVIGANGAFKSNLAPDGVTCSGITASTVTVNGGIVTHC